MQQVMTSDRYLDKHFRDKNGVVTVGGVLAAPSGGSSNTSLVAGVSGKVIRVLSGQFISNGAGIALASFKSSSGGSLVGYVQTPANTAATPMIILPENENGWFIDTTAGQGLFVDVATTQMLITLRYVIFTP